MSTAHEPPSPPKVFEDVYLLSRPFPSLSVAGRFAVQMSARSHTLYMGWPVLTFCRKKHDRADDGGTARSRFTVVRSNKVDALDLCPHQGGCEYGNGQKSKFVNSPHVLADPKGRWVSRSQWNPASRLSAYMRKSTNRFQSSRSSGRPF